MQVVCPHCHSRYEIEVETLPAKVYCGICSTKSLIHEGGRVEVLVPGETARTPPARHLGTAPAQSGSASVQSPAPTRRRDDPDGVVPAAPRRVSLEQTKAEPEAPRRPSPPQPLREPVVWHDEPPPRSGSGVVKVLFFLLLLAVAAVALVPALRNPLLDKLGYAPPAGSTTEVPPPTGAGDGDDRGESPARLAGRPDARSPLGDPQPPGPSLEDPTSLRPSTEFVSPEDGDREDSRGTAPPRPPGPATLANAAPQIAQALAVTDSRIAAQPASAEAEVRAFLKGLYRPRLGRTIAQEVTARHPELVLELLGGLWQRLARGGGTLPETPELKIFNNRTAQVFDLTDYYREVFGDAGGALSGERLRRVAERDEVRQLLAHFAEGGDDRTEANALWVGRMVHEAGRSSSAPPPSSSGGSGWFGRTNPFGTPVPPLGP